jgi:tetratricopeptide (TPR) repeat protein
MPPPIRKYDELGFPIPATFDDLSLPSSGRDFPQARAGSTDNRPSRKKKLILGVLLVGIVAAIAIPWLTDAGQKFLGDWLAQRARKKFSEGDMPGTVADSTRAFTLLGDELDDERRIELLAIRGCARLETNDLSGGRADFDRVLSSPKTDRRIRLMCYLQRSWLKCRMKEYAAAIDDASAALTLNGRDDPIVLNQRAYIRALANAEKPKQDELAAGLDDVERALGMTPGRPAFIDTKGYLLHLLGRNDEALAEMSQAIATTAAFLKRAYRAEQMDRLREDLAVMYYHRSLIYEKLGRKAEAVRDFDRALECGYDPDAGVL